MIPNKIVIHHEAGNSGFNSVNLYHKEKWGSISSLGFYIGYHYYIEKNGRLYQGRRDNEIGLHCIPNDGKIGICLQGNSNNEKPTEAQFKTLIELTEKLKKAYNIQAVHGHRDLWKTECPGTELYKWVLEQKISWLKKLIAFLKGR